MDIVYPPIVFEADWQLFIFPGGELHVASLYNGNPVVVMKYGVLLGSEELVVALMKGCLAGYSLYISISSVISHSPLEDIIAGVAVICVP